MGFYDLTGETELGVYLLLWLDMYKDRLAKNTYNGYRVNITKHIIPYLGAERLSELRPIQLQQLYPQLKKDGLSGTSCVYVHNTLHKAMDTAVRLELISRNPAQLVEPPRKERFTPMGYDISGVKTMNSNRTLLLADGLLALLYGFRSGAYEINPEGWLFWRMGRLLCPGYLSYHFEKLLAGSGIPHIRFHDLRHPYVKPTTKNILLQNDLKRRKFFKVFLFPISAQYSLNNI